MLITNEDIGKTVYCKCYGKGIIKYVVDSRNFAYEVTVKFKNFDAHYNKEGHFYNHSYAPDKIIYFTKEETYDYIDKFFIKLKKLLIKF